MPHEQTAPNHACIFHLMSHVLDRLANGESFDKVVEETGITARVTEAKNAAPWWAISGRIPGDDEDACFIVQTKSREEAEAAFSEMMFANSLDPEEARAKGIAQSGSPLGVYINSAVVSRTPIVEM